MPVPTVHWIDSILHFCQECGSKRIICTYLGEVIRSYYQGHVNPMHYQFCHILLHSSFSDRFWIAIKIKLQPHSTMRVIPISYLCWQTSNALNGLSLFDIKSNFHVDDADIYDDIYGDDYADDYDDTSSGRCSLRNHTWKKMGGLLLDLQEKLWSNIIILRTSTIYV